MLVVDRYSDYIDVFPLSNKSAADAQAAFIEYFGTEKPTDVYLWSDSAPEPIKSIKQLGVPHGIGPLHADHFVKMQ